MSKIHYYNSRLKSYYEVVTTVTLRNIKLRYKNSFLGFFWSLLSPLMYLGIFIVVFSNIFPSIENYPLYALTGLLFWNFFSSSSVQMLNTIFESAGILKSFNVPAIIFPISGLAANLINFLFSLIPFFFIMLFFGFRPSPVTILIIPALFSFTLFTFSLSLILCSLNVFFRDIAMFWNTVLPAFFYATPVVYPVSQLPERAQFLMNFNPFYHYIMLFRDILYYGKIPDSFHVIISTVLTVFVTVLGILVYKSLKKGFISNF